MTSSARYPIRILHVLGGMNRGGIETWLMHILRNIDRDRLAMDFLVHTNQPCRYDDEVLALGSRIIPCLSPSNPKLYSHNFKQILSKYGPYDIVHSHVHYFSGYVLNLAKQSGVPVRIAHSHIDTSAHEAQAGLKRKLYVSFMKWQINRFATLGIACSQDAAKDLFGRNWQADKRWQLLYYGIDFSLFQTEVDGVALRQSLGIPLDALVIGHVGRLEPQKNHRFLLEIFQEVLKQEPRARLLLVGEGSLYAEIVQQAELIGIKERIIFTGSRPDVPYLMQSVMDKFLFPSLYEGLGIVLIEAQAAGLPCLISDTIPQEADVIHFLVRRLSLSQSASKWAEVLLSLENAGFKISRAEAWQLVSQSRFSIQNSLQHLQDVYQEQVSNSTI